MSFDEWWQEQIKNRPDDLDVPTMWIALRNLAKDAWDASRNNLKEEQK